MGDSLRVDQCDSISNAVDDPLCRFLRQARPVVLRQVFFQISTLAVLEHQVEVVGGLEGLVQVHDVRVVYAFYYAHLFVHYLFLFGT